MSNRTPPSLTARRTLKLIEAVIGTTRIKGIILAIALLVTLGWFSDSLFNLITLNFQGAQTLFGIALFPGLIGYLYITTRRSGSEVTIHVTTDDNPAQAKALILVLSPPRGDEKLLNEQLPPLEKNSPVLDKFNGWLMPMVAIAHHLGRLKHIVVIPSADHNRVDPETRGIKQERKGTYHDMEEFKKLVRNLTTGHNDLHIHALSELLPEYSRGIDFEDVNTLATAMDRTIGLLKQRHNIPEYDALIDITGGQKTPTIAGAIVALSEGRRFQYVSTHNKKVLTYDVTYE